MRYCMLFKHLLFTSLIFSLLTACGGGTTGTGELVNRNLSGQVVDQDNNALANVKISVLESGDTANTDSAGQFELVTNLPQGDFNLLVETSELQQTLNISGVSDSDQELLINIKVDVTGGSITLLSVKVEDIPTIDDTTKPINEGENQNNDEDKEQEEPETESIVKGQVVFLDNTPAQGVTVILDNKASATTDNSGFFKIERIIKKSSAELYFEYESATGKIKLSDLPKNAFVIEVKVQIKIDPNIAISNQITTEDVAILISKKVKRKL